MTDPAVAAYIAAVPEAARPRFEELRALVRQTIPDAQEVLSYGVVGYKIDAKRARVFISGFAHHLGLYPVPSAPELTDAIAPYRHGKGTLRFALDEPLPRELIVQVVRALTA